MFQYIRSSSNKYVRAVVPTKSNTIKKTHVVGDPSKNITRWNTLQYFHAFIQNEYCYVNMVHSKGKVKKRSKKTHVVGSPSKNITRCNTLRYFHAFNQNEHCYVNMTPSKGIKGDNGWCSSFVLLDRSGRNREARSNPKWLPLQTY